MLGSTTPLPEAVRYLVARTILLASASVLIAAMTSLAVLVTAPAALVAGRMRIALPVTVTSSAWLAVVGGTIWARNELPPRWPMTFEVTTTVRACWVVSVAGLLVDGAEPATGRPLSSMRTYGVVALGAAVVVLT